MMIGRRLRELRERKGLSQGDIEHASGLLRCYLSRVEHGHTVPSLETLEKIAVALDVPLYQLFYDRAAPPPKRHPTAARTLEEVADDTGPAGREARFLLQLRPYLAKMSSANKDLLLEVASKLVARAGAHGKDG